MLRSMDKKNNSNVTRFFFCKDTLEFSPPSSARTCFYVSLLVWQRRSSPSPKSSPAGKWVFTRPRSPSPALHHHPPSCFGVFFPPLSPAPSSPRRDAGTGGGSRGQAPAAPAPPARPAQLGTHPPALVFCICCSFLLQNPLHSCSGCLEWAYLTAKKQIISRACKSVPPPSNQSSFSLTFPVSPLHFNPSTAYIVNRCQEPRQPGLLHERVALYLFKLQYPIQTDLIVQRHKSKYKRIREQGTTLHSSIHWFSLIQLFTSTNPPHPKNCIQLKMWLGCCTPAG